MIKNLKVQSPTLSKKIYKSLSRDPRRYKVFLSRFIRPVAPPPELGSPDNDPLYLEKVIRFVSLIPSIDASIFQDLPDIWIDNQTMLDMCFGDYEEHAILLCCYIKWY